MGSQEPGDRPEEAGSKPVLEYRSIMTRPFPKDRVRLAVLSLVVCIVAPPLLLVPAVWLSAAGDGSIFLVILFFPWGVVTGNMVGAVASYGLYALLLVTGALCGHWRHVFWGVCLLHVFGFFCAVVRGC